MCEYRENLSGYPGSHRDDVADTEKCGCCGLAAPQINLPIKLFVVNSRDSYACMSIRERERFFSKDDCGIEETFINAEITGYSDEVWTTGEGCLSIPDLYEEVTRPWSITIKYQDKEFNEQVKVYHGYTARIIQHEFEHTEGKLYIDHLSPFRKQLLRNKLARILKRKINASYPTQKSY